MTTFKQAKRKNLKSKVSKLDYLKLQFNSMHDTISERSGDSKFRNIIKTLDQSIKSLEDEIKSLPVRHEYREDFYIRKPYSQPLTSIKVEQGSAIMREDLVTWEVRDKDGKYITGARDIFKDDQLTQCVLREDGVAIFEDEI